MSIQSSPSDAATVAALRSDPPQVMKPAEAAIYLSICPRLLWDIAHKPGSSLRPLKIGRSVRYRRAALDRWLDLQSALAY